MVTPLLLCAALSLGQGGELEIGNPRSTYGHLGAVRPKGKGILPGDVACFSFDVKNLKHDANGKAAYSIAIQVQNPDGEVVYEQKPHNAVATNFFGGNVLPSSAYMDIPLDAKPGVYKWKVTVEDRNANKSTTLSGEGNVLMPDFGLVRVGTFADAESRVPVSPVGVVGETLYVAFAAVGFGRTNKNEPDLHVEMRILDDKGQPTLAKPLVGQVNKDVPASIKVIPLQFALALNRAGHYTVELSARCVVCSKTVNVSFPLRILPME
jgi:hypothetical protein